MTLALLVASILTTTPAGYGAAAREPRVLIQSRAHAYRSLPFRSAPRSGGATLRPGVPRLGPTAAPSHDRTPMARTSMLRALDPMPAPIVNRIGMTRDVSGYIPPDPVGDVSADHYVQAINSHLRVYDTTGAPVTKAAPIKSLWDGAGGACEVRNDGDPIVLHDDPADRWVVTQFTTLAPYKQCVAVSATEDPTGAWWAYEFRTSSSDFVDYPKFGVWRGLYLMTANLYDPSEDPTGAGLYVFERNRMLQGRSARMQGRILDGEYGYLPADLDGTTLPPAGEPATFLRHLQGSPDVLQLRTWDVDLDDPHPSDLSAPVNIDVDPTAPPCANIYVCVPQPHTSQKLDSIADLLMFRLAYRNFGPVAKMVVTMTADAGPASGIAWWQLDKAKGARWMLARSGVHAPNTIWRWIGSAAMDISGDIAIGYSATRPSTGTYPGLRYAGLRPMDPDGVLGLRERVLVGGGGSQTGSPRYGDYASMSVSPADGCTFWFTGEYMPSTGQRWATRIGAFRLPRCRTRALAIGDVTRDEGNAGTTVFTFVVALTSEHTRTVRVDYRTVQGTATDDFTPETGTLTFNPGITTRTATIAVAGDAIGEPNETLTLVLSAAENAAIADGEGVGTILDDD